MRPRPKDSVALLLLCALPLPRARGETLSLSDCLARAREQSIPAVRAALEEGAARASLRSARGVERPQLRFRGQLLRSDDASTNLPDDNNATLILEQSLNPLSPDWVRARQSAAQARAAALARAETDADVALEIKSLYFSILKDSDAVASLDQVSGQLRGLLDTVLPKFSIGRVPAFDPVKVRLALADLSRQRGLTRARLDARRRTLASAVGLQDASGLVLAPVAGSRARPPGDLSAEVLQGDPTLAALGQETRAARLGATAAARARWPDLIGGLEYGYADYATSGMTRGWAARLGLRVPLYDGGQISARTDRARAEVRLARARVEERRQFLLARLARVRGEARTHRGDQQVLAALLPQVRQAALAEVKRYRLGAAGVLEATDALNLWLNALLQERAAYYSYLTDLATLERLTGGRYTAAYDR